MVQMFRGRWRSTLSSIIEPPPVTVRSLPVAPCLKLRSFSCRALNEYMVNVGSNLRRAVTLYILFFIIIIIVIYFFFFRDDK